MTGQLPPDKVAEIDQRVSMYGTNLDTMINLYRALLAQFGTAGAQVALSKSFARQTAQSPEKSGQAFRNLLIAAIARLADTSPAEDIERLLGEQ